LDIVLSAVFENFKDSNGHFFCSAAHFNKDVASMLSLYRASQLAFPGENILDEAKSFTSKYLKEALEKSETFTSWNNKQNLSEEVTKHTSTAYARMSLSFSIQVNGLAEFLVLFATVRLNTRWRILGMPVSLERKQRDIVKCIAQIMHT
jgi:HPt (histidine-containing phosphotransfer) domain-containing protein